MLVRMPLPAGNFSLMYVRRPPGSASFLDTQVEALSYCQDQHYAWKISLMPRHKFSGFHIFLWLMLLMLSAPKQLPESKHGPNTGQADVSGPRSLLVNPPAAVGGVCPA